MHTIYYNIDHVGTPEDIVERSSNYCKKFLDCFYSKGYCILYCIYLHYKVSYEETLFF